MKNYLLLILIFLRLNAFSQLSAVDYASEKFAQFKGSKTYVVKTGDQKFDSEMEMAMNDLWKITPFEIISSETFETKIPDKSASFILPASVGEYDFLILIVGGKKNLQKYVYEDMVAYCPIHHWGNETVNTECAYRVRNMMESMIEAVDIVQKKSISGSSLGVVSGLRGVYNSKSRKIKDRTLLICNDALVITLPSKGWGTPKPKDYSKEFQTMFGGKYPFKYEFCGKEKIESVIKEKSTEYYYLQPAMTHNKTLFVFDPSNGEVVYFDYAIQGLKITDGDVEDLVNTIKGTKK
jgi:hypothetical protein